MRTREDAKGQKVPLDELEGYETVRCPLCQGAGRLLRQQCAEMLSATRPCTRPARAVTQPDYPYPELLLYCGYHGNARRRRQVAEARRQRAEGGDVH